MPAPHVHTVAHVGHGELVMQLRQHSAQEGYVCVHEAAPICRQDLTVRQCEAVLKRARPQQILLPRLLAHHLLLLCAHQ